MKPISGKFAFPLQPTLQPTSNFPWGGLFSRSNPRRSNTHTHTNSLQRLQVSLGVSTPVVSCHSDKIGWFQDCMMRRIRRSAGAVLARVPDLPFATVMLCAPSGRTIKDACRKDLASSAKARVFLFCPTAGFHPSSII